MKKIRFLFLAAAVALLAACGQETPAIPGDVAQAAQPQQSSGGGFLSSMGGAFAGSMLGNMLSRPAAPAYHPSPTVIVNRTTIIKKTVPAPAPAAKAPSYTPRPSVSPSRSFSPPSSFRSSPSFGGRR